MRVLVAPDAIGGHPARTVGFALARAWAKRGAEVAVVPMASDGSSLADVLAYLEYRGPVLDLSAELPDEIPAGVIGVVAEDQLNLPLTGLHGLAAATGRQDGTPLEEVLAQDAEWARWALTIWPEEADAALRPGGGAHGGAGLRILAAGGRLLTGPALCAEIAGLARTVALADLIVTGCSALDFGSFGGPVVTEMIRQTRQVARPLIVVTGQNSISVRELRQAGVEAAYEIRHEEDDDKVSVDEIATTADRVAASWSW